jgi:hypothetical protein
VCPLGRSEFGDGVTIFVHLISFAGFRFS